MNVYPHLQDNRIKAAGAALAVVLLAGCSGNPSEPPAAPESVPSSNEPSASQANVQLSKIKGAHGTILFAASSAENSNHDIYLGDLATGKVTNLTDSPATDELNPQVAPNGAEAVYDGQDNKGNYQIFGVDIATKKIRQITDHDANDFDPTYTKDGKYIIYKSNAADGYGDIWKMKTDGSDQQNLTAGMSQSEEWKPTAVSDNTIVFTSRQPDDGSKSRQELSKTDELYSLNIDTRNAKPVRLTFNDRSDWYPEATKNPNELTYVTKLDESDPDTIFRTHLENGRLTKPEQLNPSNVHGDSSDGSMMADNKTLLYVNNRSGNYRAYAINGKKSYELATATGDILSPVTVDAKIS